MTRPLCFFLAAMFLAGCRGPAPTPAPTGEKELDLGVVEPLGQSKLAGLAGRHMILIVPADKFPALAAKLAPEKDALLHNLLFDLAGDEETDTSDQAAVKQYVLDWIQGRYFENEPSPAIRVELRQDTR